MQDEEELDPESVPEIESYEIIAFTNTEIDI